MLLTAGLVGAAAGTGKVDTGEELLLHALTALLGVPEALTRKIRAEFEGKPVALHAVVHALVMLAQPETEDQTGEVPERLFSTMYSVKVRSLKSGLSNTSVNDVCWGAEPTTFVGTAAGMTRVMPEEGEAGDIAHVLVALLTVQTSLTRN